MYRDQLGEFVFGYFLPGDPVLLLHPSALVFHVFPRNKIQFNTEHHYNISKTEFANDKEIMIFL